MSGAPLNNDPGTSTDEQAKLQAQLKQDVEGGKTPGDETPSHLGVGPAYTMLGMVLFLAVIAGMFAFLRAISMPDLGKWLIFSAAFVLAAGWWLVSVSAADRRVQQACCSSKRPASPGERMAQQQYAESLVKFADETSCSPEGAHFIADAIYFSPNYFCEDESSNQSHGALSSAQVLVAVVRYAQECFGDDAEQRMAEWGFASREKLEFLIKELAARDLARLGTPGFSLAFNNGRSGDFA